MKKLFLLLAATFSLCSCYVQDDEPVYVYTTKNPAVNTNGYYTTGSPISCGNEYYNVTIGGYTYSSIRISGAVYYGQYVDVWNGTYFMGTGTVSGCSNTISTSGPQGYTGGVVSPQG